MTSDNSNKKQPLRRGKACLNCRHLKIRCDGTRPVCGPCQRVPKDDPCEFTDTTSRTQELEHAVFRLQSRINELEGASGSSNYGFPYDSQHASARASPFSSPGSQSSPSEDSSFLGFQEPPLVMIQTISPLTADVSAWTISFRTHLNSVFFLHPTRFRDATLLPLPFGDERRPSPALLSAAYLWGVHLSRVQPFLAAEPVFLKRAQQHISTEISAHTPPSHVLHTIQAQVLLATYLFRNKRFLEAEFHANGAATLVLGYQLHKIRSSRPMEPPLLGVPVLLEIYPAPPKDSVEEGERIRGFWAVTCLQSNLNIALNSTSGSCVLESPGADIDTPWPLELADYEAGLLPPDYRGQESIRHFLTDDPLPASPVCMLHAKASVLLYRATRLGSNWKPNLRPQELASYTASYGWLDRRLTQFWETLPPIYAFYADAAAARTLVVAHALTAAAAIKLHRSPGAADPEAQRKCVFAARAILECLGDTRVVDFVVAHPIVGSLGSLACGVLMEEVRRAREFRAGWAASLGGPVAPPSAEEGALVRDLRAGMQTMGMHAGGSPLIEYQLKKLQQQYEAM
ncbi:hypothetical protein DFH07DRAFT_1062079 [Mycena maculata]|uniref:Zn(2)-C6 fungal-type domain-containing protein n=1 Tax=Mycena maculata TaxID=230809 RepID=A0AAD7N8W7_9AGAR|nr:hypothetical protein DFH07DRAFT_1062079 [Mycena maculata]